MALTDLVALSLLPVTWWRQIAARLRTGWSAADLLETLVLERDTAAVTNVRHAALLEDARTAIRRAAESVERPEGPVPEEFVMSDLQDARAALEAVTGKRTSEDLLRHIFARFCIGK